MEDGAKSRAAALKLQRELKGKYQTVYLDILRNRNNVLILKVDKENSVELRNSNSSSFSVGLADDDNIFEWSVTLFGPPDTYFEGGMFKAQLKFPHNYPFAPPSMRFTSKMWHPNVYDDGRVCISILHNPEHDSSGYEDISERWSPAQTVETILMSVLVMLNSPNDESPANVDAAKMWREDRAGYKRKVQRCVEMSMEDL